MTTTIIITFCVLLLIAYLFDLTSSKTKIPSVILLLLLGWAVRQLTVWLEIQLPDFSPFLPVLGTIGLILIVLEGSLELELNKSKFGLIRKSIFGALLPMLALAFILAFAFRYFGHFGLKDSLLNAIPFCVISSAIAIPSAGNLSSHHKEFVIYESSLSDILGVLLFNFLAINETIDGNSFGHFALQVLIITVVSFIATIGLSFLLSPTARPPPVPGSERYGWRGCSSLIRRWRAASHRRERCWSYRHCSRWLHRPHRPVGADCCWPGPAW